MTRLDTAALEREFTALIARHDEFNWRTVMQEMGIGERACGRLIKQFETGGLITVCRVKGSSKWYSRPAQAGSVEHSEGASAIKKMWTSMMRHREFTALDVSLSSSPGSISVTQAEAQSYCTRLMKAGYLRVIVTAIPGRRDARYRLIEPTGPNPPRPRRVSGIHDPNTGAFIPLDEALQ